MKKFLSVAVAVIMLATMVFATSTFAWDKEVGAVLVPYTTGAGITIDGTMADGEWSETNKILLDGTNMSNWAGDLPDLPIQFYYSWGDSGLYMAAIVTESAISYQTSDSKAASNTTMFQISFNPAGIIAEGYGAGGLFFSFMLDSTDGTEVGANGIIRALKHNWESAADGQVEIDEEGYQGKYTLRKDGDTTIGFTMEIVLPWSLIATEDRTEALDEDDEIMLTNFNPKDTNRARAFCTATICYVGFSAPGAVISTARTCIDGNAGDFDVQSYDVVLFFMQEGETTRETATEYFTVEVTTADPNATTEAPKDETTAAPSDETNAETGANTNATTDEVTTAPTTDGEKSGFPVWAWVVIVIAVVAIVVVIIVVATKKKK